MGWSIRFEYLLSCPEGPEREERIRELVSVMTLEDKLRQMAGDTGLAALAAAALSPAIVRLGLARLFKRA